MVEEIILDNGGPNQITLYANKIEEVGANQVIANTLPTTSANYPRGDDRLTVIQNKTMIVDLLRIQYRYNIDGEINYADKTKFKYIVQNGGTFVMRYDGVSYNVVVEKYSITQISRDEVTPDSLTVKFTVLVGKTFGSS